MFCLFNYVIVPIRLHRTWRLELLSGICMINAHSFLFCKIQVAIYIHTFRKFNIFEIVQIFQYSWDHFRRTFLVGDLNIKLVPTERKIDIRFDWFAILMSLAHEKTIQNVIMIILYYLSLTLSNYFEFFN